MLLCDRDGGEGLDLLFVGGRGACVLKLIEELKDRRARVPVTCKSPKATLVGLPGRPLGVGPRSATNPCHPSMRTQEPAQGFGVRGRSNLPLPRAPIPS